MVKVFVKDTEGVDSNSCTPARPLRRPFWGLQVSFVGHSSQSTTCSGGRRCTTSDARPGARGGAAPRQTDATVCVRAWVQPAPPSRRCIPYAIR
jgi:hypothetical protein